MQFCASTLLPFGLFNAPSILYLTSLPTLLMFQVLKSSCTNHQLPDAYHVTYILNHCCAVPSLESDIWHPEMWLNNIRLINPHAHGYNSKQKTSKRIEIPIRWIIPDDYMIASICRYKLFFPLFQWHCYKIMNHESKKCTQENFGLIWILQKNKLNKFIMSLKGEV